ncbi:hypothetical protein Lalb_Chr23g0266451 [Lupinus albus]|uniref:Uncharacterized protein n=1 Tax=Lupinus albus TaxID=3870 RepID=A0A6A4N2F0_LUPAL|nr:hypothetical protein Lalb_Chr23g0266451 [Lupinus albus]
MWHNIMDSWVIKVQCTQCSSLSSHICWGHWPLQLSIRSDLNGKTITNGCSRRHQGPI